MRARSFPARRSRAALLGLLLLGGCAGAQPIQATGALIGANAFAIPVFHRDLFDLAYSLITGKNCSVVRLDEEKSYCKAVRPPPPPQEYCTRSLADVDCWTDPARVANLGPSVADGPSSLTPAQERNRTAPWPDL